MQPHSFILLAVLGFFAVSHASAQTWTQPIQLAYTSTQFLSENTCAASDTIDIYEGWFDGAGPDIVYQLRNRQPVGSPHFSSAVVTLIPPSYYQSMDFEMFACQLKYGNVAENCALESDNIGRPGQPFLMSIPNQYETYRIVVTAANESTYSYIPCVPYTLVVQRSP